MTSKAKWICGGAAALFCGAILTLNRQNISVQKAQPPERQTSFLIPGPKMAKSVTTNWDALRKYLPEVPKAQAKPFYPHLAPLSERERAEFKVVDEQVDRFLTWGEMDQTMIADFRKVLFELADRGVAHYARELGEASKETVYDETSAKEVLRKIDTITYLGRYGITIGEDAVKMLASRTPEWDDTGKPIDQVYTQITMEAFQSLASIDAKAAQELLAKQDAQSAPAYSYSYVLGRRLAHEDDAEAFKALSSDILQYLKDNKYI